MEKTVRIYSTDHSVQDEFMQKFCTYPLVVPPKELDLKVSVDGKEYPIHVSCKNSARHQMVVVLAESSKYIWNMDYNKNDYEVVRLLVGGAEPQIPDHLVNTSWVSEVGPNWLKDLVAKFLKPRFSSPYETQAETFVSDIEAVRAYLLELLKREIVRPTHHSANLSFKRTIPDTLGKVQQNFEHPIFRQLFKCAFGQGTDFHRENHCIVVLHQTFGGWFGIYFTE